MEDTTNNIETIYIYCNHDKHKNLVQYIANNIDTINTRYIIIFKHDNNEPYITNETETIYISNPEDIKNFLSCMEVEERLDDNDTLEKRKEKFFKNRNKGKQKNDNISEAQIDDSNNNNPREDDDPPPSEDISKFKRMVLDQL